MNDRSDSALRGHFVLTGSVKHIDALPEGITDAQDTSCDVLSAALEA